MCEKPLDILYRDWCDSVINLYQLLTSRSWDLADPQLVLGRGLLRIPRWINTQMTEHLSDSDLERIAQFVDTPAYEREPEQLLPENVEEE